MGVRISRPLILGCLAAVACIIIALLSVPAIRGNSPIVDHRTAEELGVSGSAAFETLREFEVLEPDTDLEVTGQVRVGDHAVAVTPRGVAGIGHPDGGERWRYLVHGAEVSVGFPDGGDAVVVTHTVKGLLGAHISEVVLNPETGEMLSSADLPVDPPPASGLGSAGTRVLVGDSVIAQDREQPGEEIWRADPGAWCEDAKAPVEDLKVASDSEHVHLSVLCPGTEEGRLVALSLRSGEADWEGSFPGGGQAAPAVLVVDTGSSYGTSEDPVIRALNGEFGEDHRYVSANNGNLRTPQVLTLDAVTSHVAAPGGIGERTPEALLVGRPSSIEASTAFQTSEVLVERDVLSLSDFDDAALIQENGSPRFLTPFEAIRFSSDHSTHLILDALSQIEP